MFHVKEIKSFNISHLHANYIYYDTYIKQE